MTMGATGAPTVGFVGLGSMGAPLATNLVSAGLDVLGFDAAGTEGRLPEGARAAASLAEVAANAETVVLSLPNGDIVLDVVRELASAEPRRLRTVLDATTAGYRAAQAAAELLGAASIDYADAPVSGGPAGARARTIAVMFSGSDAIYDRVQPVLAGLTDRVVRIGTEPGLGQAAKLANNFMSAVALVAASEAFAFGMSVGIDPHALLNAINTGSGRSGATEDKFPNQIVTGKYAHGFTNTLMAKDLRLYSEEVADRAPHRISDLTAEIWRAFESEQPNVDFTRIYPFVRDHES